MTKKGTDVTRSAVRSYHCGSNKEGEQKGHPFCSPVGLTQTREIIQQIPDIYQNDIQGLKDTCNTKVKEWRGANGGKEGLKEAGESLGNFLGF